MRQFKYIAGLFHTRFPLRVLILFSPLFYYLNYYFVTNERKKFRKKLEERDDDAKIKFKEFAEVFEIDEKTLLKNLTDHQKINIYDFKKDFLIIYYGDMEYFANMFKEFESITLNTFKNVKFLYILNSDEAKKIMQTFPQFIKESMTVAYFSEDFGSPNLDSNTIYVLTPEKKVIYNKKIQKGSYDKKFYERTLKDINLKIRREAESEFIKSFKF